MRIRLILILLVAVGAVTALGIASAKNRGGGQKVVVVLPYGSGIREGGSVTYLGIDAGNIERIDLSTGRVVLTLRLRRSDFTLRTSDSVRLRTTGLLGERIVDIKPGHRESPVLGSQDTLYGAPERHTDFDAERAVEAIVRQSHPETADSAKRTRTPPNR
ncbi:MAG: MlaD family protein [Gemmatimonadaceae bacterium]